MYFLLFILFDFPYKLTTQNNITYLAVLYGRQPKLNRTSYPTRGRRESTYP